ncbi:winged helix-turn-helix domain-containing protein [Aestuariibacter halophilus]|uniref:Winged helix-turn-helix domain-containing protein n=1 Tax=Fluctibacter halophilus TaxID=226011 RepID=A0ABS8G8Q6_9ALTE|nr:winged helix-turn-helix domain-containing protein [Aestuariibacter halophilus]MCC2616818.1 winged helix-turn-helix domain-containing protein [Aestuariibacter halophilus]
MPAKTKLYINDFLIDLPRSLIIRGEQQVQVEPKVLKVLYCLASRQNEVVTHQEIMQHAWAGMEVVPNALQRCIAILRKELGDDAKSPHVIFTHPKIGYRLNAEVRWLDENTTPLKLPSTPNLPKGWGIKVTAFTLAGITAILFLSMFDFLPGRQSQQYTEIQTLTQTDAHESQAIYSPDGHYIVFNRYAGGCKSHLWARQLATGQETQLTAVAAKYSGASYTVDGRELIFAVSSDCETAAQNVSDWFDDGQCRSVATLDFSLALKTPQKPVLRHQCQAEYVYMPKALSNHQYVFLQSVDGQNQMVQYNDLTQVHQVIYAPDDEYLYHFDYAPEERKLVVFGRDQTGHPVMTFLDHRGHVQSREAIRLLPGMHPDVQIKGKFSPDADYLYAVINSALFHIGLNGDMQAIKTPADNIVEADMHPISNAMLVIQGGKDVDIAQISLFDKPRAQLRNDVNETNLPFKSFARTRAQEHLARYQPIGELIAFLSDRSGSDQVWIWDNHKAFQLSDESPRNPIRSYAWAPDGRSLAWASTTGLVISDLEGMRQHYPTHQPITAVLGWVEQEQLLVTLNDPVPGALYQLDLSKNTLTPYHLQRIVNAWQVNDQIIFSNVKGEVFVRALDPHIPGVSRLSALNGDALFVHKQKLYSADKSSFVLNEYSTDGTFIRPVIQLTPTTWKVLDLKDGKLLLSQYVNINQEVAELQ